MRFYIPVLALFYIASQVTMEEFSIILAVFSITTLILEIPTGVIADFLGKRKTLIISRLCYVVEILMLAFCSGFWPLLVAKIISAVGVSLSSGTSQALLYDTLKRLRRTKEHKSISGKAFFINNMTMAFVFVIGAFFFSISPKIPAYLSILPMILLVVATYFLVEPYPPHVKSRAKGAIQHVIDAARLVYREKIFIFAMLLSLISVGTVVLVQSISSSYFQSIMIPLWVIGIIAFFSASATGIGSRLATHMCYRVSDVTLLILCVSSIPPAVLLLSLLHPVIGIFGYLIMCWVFGVTQVIIGDIANRSSSTPHRATVLSILHMSDNIGVSLLFFSFGAFVGSFSMRASLLLICMSICVYFFLIIGFFRMQGPLNKVLCIRK